MMNSVEIVTLSLAALAGVLIGAIFFGGLWWTVLYGLRSKRPALLFMVSLFVRFGLALIGFYFVGGGHLERLVACLIGFVACRVILGTLRFPKAPSSRERKVTTPRYSTTPLILQPEAQTSDSTELAEVLSDEAQVLHCRPRKLASQARRAPQPGRGRSQKDDYKDENEDPSLNHGGGPCI